MTPDSAAVSAIGRDVVVELRKLAEAATPGPWEAVSERGVANFHTSLYSDGYKGLLIACGDQNGHHTVDIKYIAAASPDVILAFIARIEALEAIIAAWDSLPEGNYSPSKVEHWLVEQMAPAIKRARTTQEATNPDDGERQGDEG